MADAVSEQAPTGVETPTTPITPVGLTGATVEAPAGTPPADTGVPAGDDGVITYDATGDAALDVALAFIGKLGIGTTDPAMVAAEKGDFSLLKASLATMGDKATGWEQMVALGEQAYARNTQANTARATETANIVHTIAGGADAWAPVQEWASANADPAEKAAINAMFAAGGVQARAAAIMLTDAYAKASGTVVTPKSATKANAGNQPVAPVNGPLTPMEYGAAVRELSQKLGNRMDASPEYAALRARLKH